MKHAQWIQRTHLFRADEYVCSSCHASFQEPYQTCPSCGREMDGSEYDPSFVDEAEILSIIFDD